MTTNAQRVDETTAPEIPGEPGRAIAARVEAFANVYVESKNYSAAYRATHDCTNTHAARVWSLASEYARRPDVVMAIRSRLEAAAKATIVTVAELLAHQYEIATADPREIVWTSEHPCRHCYGNDGAYQWRDPEEYDLACARAIDEAVKTGAVLPVFPTINGGFGFTLHRPPNPECETCAGVGDPRTHIADSRKLSGPAAKLFAGVKQDRYGQIEVKMHDQQKALDACNRIVGAYKDALTVNPGPVEAAPLPVDLPPEQVADAYLRMVR